MLKNDSVENYLKLNFLQKTHWPHMSISAISGARDAKDLPDSHFSALYFKNDK